jgi:glycyl-tRNA synthetase beta chain
MSKDLLLELGSEELPASFIVDALNALENTLHNGLEELRLKHGEVKHYGTPRRLAILIKGVDEKQTDFTREVMGPAAKVAFQADGTLSDIGKKFASSQNLKPEQLQKKQTPKGEYVSASIAEKGKPAQEVLPGLLDQAIRSLKFPKSMRWGHEEVTWARPLHWIVALFGDELVLPVSYGPVKSGRNTRGHRFLDPEPISLRSPADYASTLEKAHVYAEIDRRRHHVQQHSDGAARHANGKILSDPALLDTVTNLVEWPSAVLGSFDKSYLDLPPEVLVSEMKSHQKYFSVVDGGGKLLPHFVAISNTPVADPKVSRNGYERVLTSRLADARFFFDEDQKIKLADRVESLKKVTFQQQLGSVYEKMERFRSLALWLAGATSKGDKKVIERAATLCKADLVTGMVGEFPELQGVMGREYARKQGESDAVAVAIDEHYAPRNAGDRMPSRDEGALIGLADRLDSLCGLFGIGKKPTGATDPFGLRRLMLAIAHIVLEKGYRFSISAAVDQSLSLLGAKVPDPKKTREEVLEYLRDRLHAEWKETYRSDVVTAVLFAGFDDMVAAQKRLAAIGAIVGMPDFEPLAIAFKRAVNIVKKQAKDVTEAPPDPALFTQPEEKALFAAYQGIKGKVEAAAKIDDFDMALKDITSLKPVIDTFFDKVMVMVDDKKLKENRVRLLQVIGKLFDTIADFSQIQVP